MTNDSRYTERQFLAGGRFSSVFRATDQTNGALVALKITTPEDDLPPHNSKDELKLLKSLAEIGGSAKNIVHPLGHFDSDHIDLVMVFPYLPFTLTQLLKHNSTRIKPKFNPYLAFSGTNNDDDPQSKKPTYINNLQPDRARQIVLGIAQGLQFLHENGIIHRDIKPANILFHNLTSNPTIIDLGISYKYPNNFGKESPEKKVTDISTSIYKAPELLFGITDYSYGVDIWGFGMLMTSLFSKNTEPIFPNENVGDLRLVSLIFNAFGTPTIDTWPEASKSKTFGNMNLTEKTGESIDSLLPRADDQIKYVFSQMMIYESSKRISSKEIVDQLSKELN